MQNILLQKKSADRLMANQKSSLRWRRYIRYKIQDYAKQGLVRVATEMYTLSQTRVPFDDGELSLGARVSSEQNGDSIVAGVSYGNNLKSARYAVDQHENFAWNHAPGEQPKYLESAFNEIAPSTVDTIGYYIRSVLN